MSKEMEKKLKDIADKIAKEYKPERIILFGSYAWGTPTEDSDVDLLILKETDDVQNMEMQIDKSIFPRPFPLDILVYRPKRFMERIEQGDFFLRDIFNNGKVIYEA